MTPVLLAAAGVLEASSFLADTQGTDWLLSAIPQLGAVALLLWFLQDQLKKANERTETERRRAETAEADARAVRDVFIREIVPATTLQTDRSERLLDGLQQVVGLVERVVSSTIGKTP